MIDGAHEVVAKIDIVADFVKMSCNCHIRVVIDRRTHTGLGIATNERKPLRVYDSNGDTHIWV